MSQKNLAKFAFFYLLSLVALIFFALSVGMIAFQVINKYVVDIFEVSSFFSNDQLKFAISALIIAAPLYYFLSHRIYRGLFKGELSKESGLRRWLTYFILFVSSVIVIGSLIGVLNTFLNGELTTKFILKMLVTMIIPAIIFSFYFYDNKRENVTEKKNNVFRIYFFASLLIAVIALITAFCLVESPAQSRARRLDDKIISNFYNIESQVNAYYQKNGKLPESLDVLKSPDGQDDIFKDPETKSLFGYNTKGNTTFELCAAFRTSTADLKDYMDYQKRHLNGYRCISSEVFVDKNIDGKVVPTGPMN